MSIPSLKFLPEAGSGPKLPFRHKTCDGRAPKSSKLHGARQKPKPIGRPLLAFSLKPLSLSLVQDVYYWFNQAFSAVTAV